MESEEILVAIQRAAETIATPNWADIASVGLSLLAVIVAGFVARRQNKISKQQADISEQQNKIALFEKRYDVYYEVMKIIGIGEELDYSESLTTSIMLDVLEAALEIKISNRQDISEISTAIVARILEAEHVLDQSIFLFPHVNETDIDNLLNNAAKFISFVEMSNKKEIDTRNDCVKNFYDASKGFKKKYLKMIMEKLDLTGSA